jgi:hypothetical protein
LLRDGRALAREKTEHRGRPCHQQHDDKQRERAPDEGPEIVSGAARRGSVVKEALGILTETIRMAVTATYVTAHKMQNVFS